jgi:hypothetical protein
MNLFRPLVFVDFVRWFGWKKRGKSFLVGRGFGVMTGLAIFTSRTVIYHIVV